MDLAKTNSNSLRLHFLLTHFHWDHIQGLPFFAPLYSPTTEVTFHSGLRPEGAREVLEGQMSSPYFPVNFELLAAKRAFVYSAPEGFYCEDAFVRPFPLNHPQGATGYRIERDGAVIVHASDLEHGNAKLDKTLLEYAQDADLLVYDAQYTPEEYLTKKGWGHSTWLEATKLAAKAGVKRLLLFHHDPSHDDLTLHGICTNARQEFQATEMAREGDAFDV
jgi:phosphoribosyl 1,2-cyclic phosphodiesterase